MKLPEDRDEEIEETQRTQRECTKATESCFIRKGEKWLTDRQDIEKKTQL